MSSLLTLATVAAADTRLTPATTCTSPATTPTTATATTTTTANTTTTTTTTTTTQRPYLLHPQRPPSPNKILFEFAQSQTINSYGSWRFSTPAEDDDSKHPYKFADRDSSLSQPGSPISDSSSSGREDRLADSFGSPAYDRNVLSARASRGSSSLGSSWGISSVGKSIDWTWKTNDGAGAASDADTEPTDDDNDDDAQQERQDEQKPQAPLRPSLVTPTTTTTTTTLSDINNSNNRHERSSPLAVRSIGFHSIGSPLSLPAPTPNNIVDLSPYNSYFAPRRNRNSLPRLAMAASAPSPSPHTDIPFPIVSSPLPQSPIHSRPLSPYVSHNVSPYLSRAPSSAGSATSSRFRRRSSQKRISLIAGRVSYISPPSPPPIDGDGDGNSTGHDHGDDQQYHRSPRLLRLNSTSSFVSLASTVATAPPTPAAGGAAAQAGDYLGERSISEFVIQGDVGRGAYGLVKRGREVMSNGSYGPEVIIKQVIKSRILADCWKKHPTHGTIPIEIYVMLALSSASYVLPERRPWDPRRAIWRIEWQERKERENEDKERADSGSSCGEFNPPPSATSTTSNSTITNGAIVLDSNDDQEQEDDPSALVAPEDRKPQTLEEKYHEYTKVMQPQWEWEEGKIVRGHPNICPLIDFFEDRNFYYLILPSTLPPVDSTVDMDVDAAPFPPPPKDLFDLVEQHPIGLPAHLVRSYLGQIADAMAFLHMRGIVHRDIKDENVVLSANGDRCWLIDFGSAGIVRRNGWNSFSGTLDYASPEILRGEFYTGKEQDVWAYGVVAYVLLVGECPFATAADAQAGLVEGSSAWEGLDARCARGCELEGEEEDGGGALGDAAELVRQCLKVEVAARPTAESILGSRFLNGRGGWGMDRSTIAVAAAA